MCKPEVVTISQTCPSEEYRGQTGVIITDDDQGRTVTLMADGRNYGPLNPTSSERRAYVGS